MRLIIFFIYTCVYTVHIVHVSYNIIKQYNPAWARLKSVILSISSIFCLFCPPSFLPAEARRRGWGSAGTWRGKWLPAATRSPMEACESETGSPTDWTPMQRFIMVIKKKHYYFCSNKWDWQVKRLAQNRWLGLCCTEKSHKLKPYASNRCSTLQSRNKTHLSNILSVSLSLIHSPLHQLVISNESPEQLHQLVLFDMWCTVGNKSQHSARLWVWWAVFKKKTVVSAAFRAQTEYYELWTFSKDRVGVFFNLFFFTSFTFSVFKKILSLPKSKPSVSSPV